MPISLEEYLVLKKQADDLQRQADRAQGALEQVKAKLQAQFGTTSTKRAEQILATMKTEEEKLEREFKEAEKGFQEKWAGKLKGDGHA